MKNNIKNYLFYILIFLIITYLIILIFLEINKNENYIETYVNSKKLENIEKVGNIPKIIWSYWDSGIKNGGYLVNKSYLSWKKYHPDYEIIFLDDNNINEYIDIESYYKNINFKQFNKMEKVKKADLIRCVLLSEYGGIWIDSSFLLIESLDWLLKSKEVLENDKKIICFYQERFTKNEDIPIIENWFIAVSRNNKFMYLWKEEFYKYLKIGFKNYKKKIKNIDLQNIDIPVYLTMHVCAQKVMQENPELVKEIYSLKSGTHPFKLHFDYEWDMHKLINDIFKKKKIDIPKMIKFRGHERALFDKYIKEGKKYSEKSLYSRYIKNL